MCESINTMPTTTFLSLPPEIRQIILFLAVEASMVRKWTELLRGPTVIISSSQEPRYIGPYYGFWRDDDSKAQQLLDALRGVKQPVITEDLEWVVKVLYDASRVTQGTWCLRDKEWADRNCSLSLSGSCTGCDYHISPY
ncbi:hypothetical protein FKW77_007049 [Venturia effusa]|uniref:Uncharacterized protein n=1 Tax=Venturia effusa TaxID=50376 RepID=A0A517LPF4_9PEZI|nr:hypothetical protein FKW77_007049 [Venturia effusa]